MFPKYHKERVMIIRRVRLIDIYEAIMNSGREKQRVKGNMLGWCRIEVRELDIYTGFMKDGGLIRTWTRVS